MPKPAGQPVKRPFEAYAGDEPYVFVSYAHADMGEVFQDLAHVHRQGYRIWYDEGVDPAERFALKIPDKIQGCIQFIAFLSANAARSEWVLREITYAVSEGKERLFVYFEEPPQPTDMIPEKERQFWQEVKFVQGGRDYLSRTKWEDDQYLGRLCKFLSPATTITVPSGPEGDLEREVKRRVTTGGGWSDSLREELMVFAELRGVTPKAAKRVIKATLQRLGVSEKTGALIEKFSKLVDHYLKQGPLVDDHRTTLQNAAKELGIGPQQWELLVQTKAAAKARELIQKGEREWAKRLLISCVGEVVPQTDEVRLLLEEAAVEARAPVSSHTAESDASQPAVTGPAEAPVAERRADRAVTRLADNIPLRWVRIPGGLFTRGCPEDFIRHVERTFGADTAVLRKFPVRKEPIDEFWISVTPVTNAQYYEFVRAAGHRFPAGWRGMVPPYPPADANKPVTGVNFRDSVDFAAWIGARLPTRAEHEKASRGEDGRLFPWGNEFDPKRCNTQERYNTQESKHDELTPELTPVDAFPDGASPYGVLDLVGNAWEWVDGQRGELTMTVGASYRATGEIFGATFFDVSRPPESSEKDLGFRIACGDVRLLQRTTTEAP